MHHRNSQIHLPNQEILGCHAANRLELTGMIKRETEEELRRNETKSDETGENSEGHGPPANSSEPSLAGVNYLHYNLIYCLLVREFYLS